MNARYALESFARQDSVDKALLLLEDKRLGAMVLAWNNISVSWQPPEEIDDARLMKDNALWNTLWSYSDYDRDDLAMASGMSLITSQQVLHRVIALKLVYPDGTISTSARKVLSIEVVNAVQKASRGRPKNQKQLEACGERTAQSPCVEKT